MADIRPFKAIRPRKDLADRIAALPYDVYDTMQAREEIMREPYSFLRIDRAETQFLEGVDPYCSEVYEKAKELLWGAVACGEFVQDKNECYYIYELTLKGRTQTGIAACASIEDYHAQVIKRHENTRKDKELDRICHVSACEAQTGPIFLAYRSDPVIAEVVKRAKKGEALYDFTSPDLVRHRVFVINTEEEKEKLLAAFASIQRIYIADGHHRCASAVAVGDKKKSREAKYFLSVLFPAEELKILPYHRVVRDLNGLSEEQFLNKIKDVCTIEPMGTKAFAPKHKGTFGMCLRGNWYRLSIRLRADKTDPVEGLDVAFLQSQILAPVLGIMDPKTDHRIDFVGGIKGLKELERRVLEEGGTAFSMYPTSIEELFCVADENRLMPPKSTWFEPKLRSGIFIHDIR